MTTVALLDLLEEQFVKYKEQEEGPPTALGFIDYLCLQGWFDHTTDDVGNIIDFDDGSA